MVRPRKTDQRGVPVPDVPTGLPYGEHQALEQALEAMPMRSGAPAAGGPNPPPGGPPADPRMQAQEAVESAIGALGATPFRGPILTSPTRRPGEPVTAGLASGAGAGPEVLQRGVNGRVAEMLQEIAQVTGDPLVARYAADAAARRL